ncbi:MAG: DNA repair protein RadC [Lachnospiraceae bacterium]|nr:DNA repair protein RadC [Lachnospiraceae bacterium]
MRIMHISIEELPDVERPYEKFIKYGAGALTDTELVAILLQSGTKDHSSLELARRVLSVGEDISVLALYEKSLSDLMRLKGIGVVKAMRLKCVAELSKRIHVTKKPEKSVFSSPKEIADYYMESLRHLYREQLIAVFFDGGGRFLCDEVISVGCVNHTLISAREVFISALKAQAVYLMLLHNHPSGNATPSQDDILMTENIRAAGEMLHIPLLDHLIIGDREYVSFKESGLL